VSETTIFQFDRSYNQQFGKLAIEFSANYPTNIPTNIPVQIPAQTPAQILTRAVRDRAFFTANLFAIQQKELRL
jgi:hypothetical protein